MEDEHARSVLIDCSTSKYPVVPEAAKTFGWKCVAPVEGAEHDWTMYWQDTTFLQERLLTVKPYQIVNHIPGMLNIARKGALARLMMKMRTSYAEEFSFSPRQWVLPDEIVDFRSQLRSRPGATFILKPNSGCQGKGIVLIQGGDDIQLPPMEEEMMVAQEYIEPFLLDGFKFDLRVYVYVVSVSPLEVRVFRDGLARFATKPYEAPSAENIGNAFMHLTNYAINKLSPDFEAVDVETGFKRSIVSVFADLAKRGINTNAIWSEIDALVAKTLIATQPHLVASIAACNNVRCFELLGFDVLISASMKPYLLEVNHAPSMRCETPADDCKKIILMQIFNNLQLDPLERSRYHQAERRRQQQRLYGGRKPASTSRAVVSPRALQADDEEIAGEEDEAWDAGTSRAVELDAVAQKASAFIERLGGAQFERVYPVVVGDNPYAHIKGPAARLIVDTTANLRRMEQVQKRLQELEEKRKEEELKSNPPVMKLDAKTMKKGAERLTKVRNPAPPKQAVLRPPKPSMKSGSVCVPIKTVEFKLDLDFGVSR